MASRGSKVTPDLYVDTARTYLNTPFLRTGRCKGPGGGIDCFGIVACSAEELGLALGQYAGVVNYNRLNDFATLIRGIYEHCVPFPFEERTKADILIFKHPQFNHCGIHTGWYPDPAFRGIENRFIEKYIVAGDNPPKVQETEFTKTRWPHIYKQQVWRLKEFA